MSEKVLERRTTTSIDRIIRETPSFKAVLELAAELQKVYGDAWSSSAIANHFLRHNQEDLMTGLRLRLQSLDDQKVMETLRLACDYSWEASMLCASLLRSVLNSRVYMKHVEEAVFEVQAGHNTVSDLLQKLGNAESLFVAEPVVEQIRGLKERYNSLFSGAKSLSRRFRVRAFKRTAMALKRTAMAFVSKTVAGLMRVLQCVRNVESDPEFHKEEPLPPRSDRYLGLRTMHLDELRHRADRVNRTLDTSICQMNSSLIYLDNSFLIFSLRNELFSMEEVAEQIIGNHVQLNEQLRGLKEQVLKCFSFIDSTRELVYL